MSREKERINNVNLIEAFIAKGVFTPSQIAFFLLKNYGLSEKFVLKFIDEGIENDLYIIDKIDKTVKHRGRSNEEIKGSKTQNV